MVQCNDYSCLESFVWLHRLDARISCLLNTKKLPFYVNIAFLATKSQCDHSGSIRNLMTRSSSCALEVRMEASTDREWTPVFTPLRYRIFSRAKGFILPTVLLKPLSQTHKEYFREKFLSPSMCVTLIPCTCTTLSNHLVTRKHNANAVSQALLDVSVATRMSKAAQCT